MQWDAWVFQMQGGGLDLWGKCMKRKREELSWSSADRELKHNGRNERRRVSSNINIYIYIYKSCVAPTT